MPNLKDFYQRHRVWILLFGLTLLLFIVTFVPIAIFLPVKKIFDQPELIRSTIQSYGSWAIAIYVVLSIFTIIIPAVPNEVVTVVGGIAFPFWQALLFGLIARVIGSSINYLLGRGIRKGIFNKLINDEEREKLKKYTDKIGWQTAFIARFLPSTDTDLVAYMAGMAKMNYLTFIISSFLGMLVPVSAAIIIGSSLLKSKTLFIVLAAFYVVGMLAAPFIFKRFRRKVGLPPEQILEKKD
ncbi:MAG: VTT domain-containing protein [Patescibacteria group bacterium]|jgi:uncharacterized membrane protein YdjX (TVP38/TMEM64 family)